MAEFRQNTRQSKIETTVLRAFCVLACAYLCAATSPAAAQSPVLQPGDDQPELIRESEETCRGHLIDCATSAQGAVPSCVRNIQRNPECQGTALGELLAQRGALESFQDRGETSPELVIAGCLSNFDSQLLGYAIANMLARDEVRSLSRMLRQCAQTISSDLLRP